MQPGLVESGPAESGDGAPRRVRLALWLLYATLALEFVDSVFATLHSTTPRPARASVVLGGVLALAIPLFVIVMIQLRQNWARFLYAAGMAVSLLLIAFSPSRLPGPSASLLRLGVLGLGLAPVVLLFGGSASRWFYRLGPEGAESGNVPGTTAKASAVRERPPGRSALLGMLSTILNILFSLLAIGLLALVPVLAFFAFLLGPQLGSGLGFVAGLVLFAVACLVSVLKCQRARYIGRTSTRTLAWSLLPLPFIILAVSPLAYLTQGIHGSDVFSHVASRSAPTLNSPHAVPQTPSPPASATSRNGTPIVSATAAPSAPAPVSRPSLARQSPEASVAQCASYAYGQWLRAQHAAPDAATSSAKQHELLEQCRSVAGLPSTAGLLPAIPADPDAGSSDPQIAARAALATRCETVEIATLGPYWRAHPDPPTQQEKLSQIIRHCRGAQSSLPDPTMASSEADQNPLGTGAAKASAAVYHGRAPDGSLTFSDLPCAPNAGEQ
jgi:FtsH-binding integral membrane protein